MALKKRKQSFEDRLNAAKNTAAQSVTVVEKIALDLEEAAADKRTLITDIDAETDRLYDLIDRIQDLRHEAVRYEAENLAKADKIRALVSA